MTQMFKKAERKQAKLKLALTGPSGSGKTYSGLKIAAGLGKKIAVIDTENDSASLYAGQVGIPEFDTCPISPPYTIEKYRAAIKAAVQAGYDVLVVDSLSHAWQGEGGLLEQKEALDARGRGNSYTNWATITKQHEAFKSEILNADVHMICTMRSKQEYAQMEENGKKVVKKLGMAPIQRDGMEYEFTVVLDMAMNHTAEASKDRTSLFDGKIFTPSEKVGEALLKWLQGGAKVKAPESSPLSPPESAPAAPPAPTEPPPADAPPPQAEEPPKAKQAAKKSGPWSPKDAERKEVLDLAKKHNWLPESVVEYLGARFGKQKLGELTLAEYTELKVTIQENSWTQAMAATREGEQAELLEPGAMG